MWGPVLDIQIFRLNNKSFFFKSRFLLWNGGKLDLSKNSAKKKISASLLSSEHGPIGSLGEMQEIWLGGEDNSWNCENQYT